MKKSIVIEYRVMRDPTTGGMLYLTHGVGFPSMKMLKEYCPEGAVLKRVKATRRNKIFG